MRPHLRSWTRHLRWLLRTTLDIDEDVLLAARDLARRRRAPLGRVVSDLARQGLIGHEGAAERSGVALFPVRADAGVVTLDLVNRLRDEAP